MRASTASTVAVLLLLVTAGARAEGAPPDPAGLVVRIQRLEEEVARLRGRVEELEYALRRQQARLRALEERGAPAVAAAPVLQDATPPRPSAATTVPAAGSGETATPAQAATSPPTAPAGESPRATTAELPTAETGGGARGWPGPETGPAPGAPAPELAAALTGTPEERYRRSLALLEAGKFDEAAEAFSRFLEDFPKDPRAADAAFWLAETHFFRRDYATAAQLYARNYRTYGPQSPRAPDNLLKLGMALAAIGERERACRTFAELERRHPRAPAYIRQQLAREKAADRCE